MDIIVTSEKNIRLELLNQETKEQIKIKNKFAQNPARGLLGLLDFLDYNEPAPSLQFWKEFTKSFLKTFCIQCDNKEITTYDSKKIDKFLSLVPLTKGSYYIDKSLLKNIWISLESYMLQQINEFEGSSRDYINLYFPNWAQVGKIHFHLAENPGSSEFPFAFLATCITQLGEDGQQQHTPLGNLIKEHLGTKNHPKISNILNLIKNLSLKGNYISHLIQSKKIYTTNLLSSIDAYNFLNEVHFYEEQGIVTKLPKQWNEIRPSRPKISVNISEKSYLGINNVLKFDISLTIDGNLLEKNEITKILNQDSSLIQINGKWIEVNQKKISSLLKKWKQAAHFQEQGISFFQALRMLSKTSMTKSDNSFPLASTDQPWVEVNASETIKQHLSSLVNPLESLTSEINTSLAKNFKGKLRDYQKKGVQWLNFISKISSGGCLADDMGLGKTVQIISALILEKDRVDNCTSLLIVPASLLGNWESELCKFAPNLNFKILHPSFSSKHTKMNFCENKIKNDLLITTYTMAQKILWLKDINWNFIILDEAQAIKNPKSRQTQYIKSLKSRVRIALTGTPIENNIMDLWSIFDFTNPSLLGTSQEFYNFYKNNRSLEEYKSLKKLIQPYLLRRLKNNKSIIPDLPQKIEIKNYCMLTKEQLFLYKKTIDDFKKKLTQTTSNEITRKGMILSYLMKFKQICNHPAQMIVDNDFTYSRSGKFFRLKEICEKISNCDDKVIVFTQFKETTTILNYFLQKIFCAKGYVLHGSITLKKRIEMIKSFQTNDNIKYFILSIKAGGTGINLTKASHVIHFDRWWNPAIEDQASDRAYRIGQKKKVIVHKLITKGTIEEKIDHMIDDKKNISKKTIEELPQLKVTELNNQEILDLVTLRLTTQEL